MGGGEGGGVRCNKEIYSQEKTAGAFPIHTYVPFRCDTFPRLEIAFWTSEAESKDKIKKETGFVGQVRKKGVTKISAMSPKRGY